MDTTEGWSHAEAAAAIDKGSGDGLVQEIYCRTLYRRTSEMIGGHG